MLRTTIFALTIAMLGCGNLDQIGPYNVAYTPEGNLVAFLPGETRIYDGDMGGAIRVIESTAQNDGWTPLSARFTLSADGKTIAIGAQQYLEVYDVGTGQSLASIEVVPPFDPAMSGPSPIGEVALSRDGTLVAVSIRDPNITTEGPLLVYRVSDHSQVAAIPPPDRANQAAWSSGLAFSADAKVLYTSDTTWETDLEGSRYMWFSHLDAFQIADGSLVWQTPLGVRGSNVIAVSPDGTTLAIGTESLSLWRTADGKPVEGFQSSVQDGATQTLSFAPDGKRIVAAYYTSAVPSDALIFDMTGAIVQSFPFEESGCAGAAFSPDGARVAGACGDYVKLWDATTGALLQRREVTGNLY